MGVTEGIMIAAIIGMLVGGVLWAYSINAAYISDGDFLHGLD